MYLFFLKIIREQKEREENEREGKSILDEEDSELVTGNPFQPISAVISKVLKQPPVENVCDKSIHCS